MRWSKMAVLFEKEGVYGQDATPDGSDAILFVATDFRLVPLAAGAVPRENVRAAGQFGSYTKLLTGIHRTVEFSVELAGAGGADTPPPYAKLIECCGLNETVTPATKVEYAPVSDDASHDSGTLYFHIDGTRYKLLGARGNVSWTFNSLQIPMLRFSFTGLFAAAADAAFPAQVLTAFQPPVIVSDANTPTITLHGTTLVLQSLTVNLGNKVEYRELVNSSGIQIVDRTPTAKIVFEHVSVATKDWIGAVAAETLAALQIIHGVGAGKIVQIDAPKVQLLNPEFSNSQNKVMLSLDLELTPNAGDDEILFTTK